MTPTEFCAALARAGYSQRGFATHVGTNERTVRRWVSGDLDIPPWVPIILGLMPSDPPF
jgi:DNA-binding transcriptional regulator YiaG